VLTKVWVGGSHTLLRRVWVTIALTTDAILGHLGSLLGAILGHISASVASWEPLECLLGPSWVPLGSLLGACWEFLKLWSSCVVASFLRRIWIRALKTSQQAPKGDPRGTQEGPKRHSRGSQEATEALIWPKMAPKRLPRWPKMASVVNAIVTQTLLNKVWLPPTQTLVNTIVHPLHPC
jgi:hypothetical protein